MAKPKSQKPQGTFVGHVVPVGIEGGRIKPRRVVVAMDLPKLQGVFIHDGTPVKAEVVGRVLVVTFEV